MHQSHCWEILSGQGEERRGEERRGEERRGEEREKLMRKCFMQT
jgi:hypothetical protein